MFDLDSCCILSENKKTEKPELDIRSSSDKADCSSTGCSKMKDLFIASISSGTVRGSLFD